MRKVKQVGAVERRWLLEPRRFPRKRRGGRNNQGVVTCRHKGGGHKRRVRPLRWFPVGYGLEGTAVARCLAIVYDPNRRGWVSLMGAVERGVVPSRERERRSLFWMLAPDGLKEGQLVYFSSSGEVPMGEVVRKPLKTFRQQREVHGISLTSEGKGVLLRSAGCKGEVLRSEGEKVWVRLSSGQRLCLPGDCWATEGKVSHGDWWEKPWRKAGDRRHRGIRPTVRGVAMNPHDHPHGGRTKGGRPSVSPWAKLAKGGAKTRKGKSFFQRSRE